MISTKIINKSEENVNMFKSKKKEYHIKLLGYNKKQNKNV